MDPVVKADQYVQYVDDIGIEANHTMDLIPNIREVVECIRKAGPKLTVGKCHFGECHFGVRQVDFISRTFSSESHHRLQKSRISSTSRYFSNQDFLYRANWASQITTGTISP